ncbi:MAG: 5-formyltetrahydrofolate cyclo-ligase [Candidatus Omnitrophica bacterium]|nr:5-formyltetrahydrofolate cyclo-ligase [Candidatus Omnitrophota bacterium]
MKNEIRKNILKKIESITESEFIEMNKKIFENFLALSEYKNCWTLMSYVSFDREPETISIIKDALSKAKSVCIPKIEWKNLSMVPVQIFNEDDIDFSQKIPQPLSDTVIKIEEIELIIVPGIAFDRNCNRLGRGKGFYDRFLSQCKNAIKVGLAFDIQIIENVPTSEHDVPVDIIVTQSQIIRKC